VAVHAIALQRHPIGPNISLLKNMNVNAPQLCQSDRHLMHRPAISKKDEIGYAPIQHDTIKE
jgi:hypothetical protein